MNTKLVQFLKSDFIVTKTDKWESYYVKQRQKYLITACCLGVFIYFIFLYLFYLSGIPIQKFMIRLKILEKFHYMIIIFFLFVIVYLCNTSIERMNKFSKYNKIKFFHYDLTIKQAHHICKFLFYISNICTAIGYNLGLVILPVQIVMISIILTFTLYIICAILGSLKIFNKLNLNQYYILVLESLFCFFLFLFSGGIHSKWYIIVISIIGIIFDSLFVLFIYNDMQYVINDLSKETKKLTDKEIIYVYDIDIMGKSVWLINTIYIMIVEFCNLLIGSTMDD